VITFPATDNAETAGKKSLRAYAAGGLHTEFAAPFALGGALSAQEMFQETGAG
jgi:hypothetical protein